MSIGTKRRKIRTRFSGGDIERRNLQMLQCRLQGRTPNTGRILRTCLLLTHWPLWAGGTSRKRSAGKDSDLDRVRFLGTDKKKFFDIMDKSCNPIKGLYARIGERSFQWISNRLFEVIASGVV